MPRRIKPLIATLAAIGAVAGGGAALAGAATTTSPAHGTATTSTATTGKGSASTTGTRTPAPGSGARSGAGPGSGSAHQAQLPQHVGCAPAASRPVRRAAGALTSTARALTAPPQNRTLRIALAQIDCALGDIQENVRRAREAIAAAHRRQADLLVFPELNLTGYSLRAIAEDVALTVDDPAITSLADAAQGMAIVLGFVEQGPVHVHNSAIYLENGQCVHVHRKAFLPTYGRFEEHKHFRAGQGLRTFDTRASRFALLICNDAWQPTLPFLAVQHGAQVLIVPANSSHDPEADVDRAIEDDWGDLLRFHARFLQVYVVFVNRVGSESGISFWGGSRVVDPWGQVIVEAPRCEPALVLAELDLRAVRRRRQQMPLVKEPRLDMLAREFARLLDEET